MVKIFLIKGVIQITYSSSVNFMTSIALILNKVFHTMYKLVLVAFKSVSLSTGGGYLLLF
jgi:hypothetical protein